MKLRALAVSVVMVAWWVVPAAAQDAMKAAEEMVTKWVTAYNAGDAAAISAMFTPDAVFNAPSGAVLKGRDAIEKALAGRMKAGWTKETITVTAAGAVGDAIWSAGEYAVTGSGENAGKQTAGHFGDVLVHEGNAWYFAMLTANITPPKQ
jgi:uncharacterized protein (TIGR02246 family)